MGYTVGPWFGSPVTTTLKIYCPTSIRLPLVVIQSCTIQLSGDFIITRGALPKPISSLSMYDMFGQFFLRKQSATSKAPLVKVSLEVWSFLYVVGQRLLNVWKRREQNLTNDSGWETMRYSDYHFNINQVRYGKMFTDLLVYKAPFVVTVAAVVGEQPLPLRPFPK